MHLQIVPPLQQGAERQAFQLHKREGTGINGADPEGYEKRMSKLHFRFIVSPDNQNVDLKELFVNFIKRLGFTSCGFAQEVT
jgi:hypothetical protein